MKIFRQTTSMALVFTLISISALAAEKTDKSQKIDRPTTERGVVEKASDRDNRESEKKMENRTSQEISDLVKDIDYPELQVVPRASDRLRMEARDEGHGWFYQHWPIQLSGLATFATATYGKNQIRIPSSDPQKNADFNDQATRILLVGQLVGGAWFLGGTLWGLNHPYRRGLNEIAHIQGNSVRAQLMRERLAEESLEAPAKLVEPLKYASVATNFVTSILMASFLSDEGRVVAAASATLAFLPLIYEDPTVYTWEKHQEYKRKIYGPVSSSGLRVDPVTKRLVPTALLSWNF